MAQYRYKLTGTAVAADTEYALSADGTIAALGPANSAPEFTTRPDGSPIVGGATYRIYWRFLNADWQFDQYDDYYIPPDPAATDTVGKKALFADLPYVAGVADLVAVQAVQLPDGTTIYQLIRTDRPAPTGGGTTTVLKLSAVLQANRTQPAVGNSIDFPLDDAAWVVPGMTLALTDNGTFYGSYYVLSVTVATNTITARNLGSGSVSAPATIPSGAKAVLSGYPPPAGQNGTNGINGTNGTNGINGTNGKSPSSLTTTAFTQPSVGGDVAVSVSDKWWLLTPGQMIAIGGSHYQLQPGFEGSSTVILLRNWGNEGAAASGSTIPINSVLLPAGSPGRDLVLSATDRARLDAIALGGFMSGGVERTLSRKRLNPNAVFGSGKYSFYNVSPPEPGGVYLPQLPNGSWWYVDRDVHDNGSVFSAHWCSETWEPLDEWNKHNSLQRKCRDGNWSSFNLNYTDLNLPAFPYQAVQLWADGGSAQNPNGQKGYKPLFFLPPSSPGTYDSLVIEGVFGPWHSALKTRISLFASNRDVLRVSYTLWGPNVDFAIVARALPDGSVRFWAYSPTGVSATNLTIYTQQGGFFGRFDAPVTPQLGGDQGVKIFDSSDTDTYPPDAWYRADEMRLKGRAVTAERYYAYSPRLIDAATLAAKSYTLAVYDTARKEYVQMTLADLPQPVVPNPTAPTVADQSATQNVALSATLPAFSHPYPVSYSLTGLPAGLTFDAGTRRITGAAQQAGTFILTYRAVDAEGRASSVSFSLNVAAAPPTAAPWLLATGVTYDVNTRAVNLFFGLASGIGSAQVAVANVSGVHETGNGLNGAWSSEPASGQYWQALAAQSSFGGTYNFRANYYPTSISPMIGGLVPGQTYQVSIRRNAGDTPVIRTFVFGQGPNVDDPVALGSGTVSGPVTLVNVTRLRPITASEAPEPGAFWALGHVNDDIDTNIYSSPALSQTGPQWIEINLEGVATAVRQLDLVPRADDRGAYPVDFKLQVNTSATGGTWTDVLTRTNEPRPQAGTATYTFSPVGGVRRVRLYTTKLGNAAGDSFRVQLQELKVWAESFTPDSNQPPVPPLIPSQSGQAGVAFSYVMPAFTDPNGDALIYNLQAVYFYFDALADWQQTDNGTFVWDGPNRTLSRSNPPQGRFKVTIRSVDIWGLFSTADILVTFTAPVSSLVMIAPTQSGTQLTLRVTGESPTAAMEYRIVEINGGTWQASPIFQLPAGATQLTLEARQSGHVTGGVWVAGAVLVQSVDIRFFSGTAQNGFVANLNATGQAYQARADFNALPAGVTPEIGVAFQDNPTAISAFPMSLFAPTGFTMDGWREGHTVSTDLTTVNGGYLVFVRVPGLTNWIEVARRNWSDWSDQSDFVRVYTGQPSAATFTPYGDDVSADNTTIGVFEQL